MSDKMAEVAERHGGTKQKSLEPTSGLGLEPSCCTALLEIDGGSGGNGGRMSEEMSERIANVAEFKAMRDDRKPFPRNGGSVGKHDTYPPSLQTPLAYLAEAMRASRCR